MPNPDPPFQSIAKVCDTQLLLSFGPVSGAMEYTIYRGHLNSMLGTDLEKLGSVPGNATGVLVAPYLHPPVFPSWNFWGVSVTTSDGTSVIGGNENGSPTTFYWNYPIGVVGKTVDIPAAFESTSSGSLPYTWQIGDPGGLYGPGNTGGYSVSYDRNKITITCSSNTFNGLGYSNSSGSVTVNIDNGNGTYSTYFGNFLVVGAYMPCPNTGGCCSC